MWRILIILIFKIKLIKEIKMFFGILKPNRAVTEVERIFINVAHEHGHEAYIFTAADVDFENKKIKGITLEKNEIIKGFFDFPVVIQNRLAVKKEDVAIYNKLSEIIPFTNHRIGTKQQVYDRMKRVDNFKKYLLQVINITTLEHFIEFITLHKKIIAKPGASNQGKGIYTIELQEQGYLVKHLSEEKNIKNEGIESFFNDILKKGKSFNFSPYFLSETNLGHGTVFRMHITRGQNGQWQLIKIFPYVNLSKASDITNGMQGALITTREQLFLEQFYPKCFKEINEELKNLFKVFTNQFQKLYAWRLDSLGLDLGISQDGEVMIYEVNSGPGIGFMAYPVACAQVKYYEWLAVNAKLPFLNNFLPLNLKDEKSL